MMDVSTSPHFASDMGRLIIRLPASGIVLLSGIVSEYDGLGFVKTEAVVADSSFSGAGLQTACKTGEVSLFFPENKRGDVLELIDTLRNEGYELEVLQTTREHLLEASDQL